jgi:hypothetical protein
MVVFACLPQNQDIYLVRPQIKSSQGAQAQGSAGRHVLHTDWNEHLARELPVTTTLVFAHKPSHRHISRDDNPDHKIDDGGLHTSTAEPTYAPCLVRPQNEEISPRSAQPQKSAGRHVLSTDLIENLAGPQIQEI